MVKIKEDITPVEDEGEFAECPEELFSDNLIKKAWVEEDGVKKEFIIVPLYSRYPICEYIFNRDIEDLFSPENYGCVTTMEGLFTKWFGNYWDYDTDVCWCDCCDKACQVSSHVDSDELWVNQESGENICDSCVHIADNMTDYIDFLTDNPNACNKHLTEDELEARGWECLRDDYESYVGGRQDNPEDIMGEYRSKYPHAKFLFSRDAYDRWGMSFSLWAKDMPADDGEETR